MLWSVETMPSSPEALPSAMTSAGVSRPSEWTVCTWGAMRYQPGLSFNCGAAYDGAGSFFCPRTFRKSDFQRPVGGAPCCRGHLDDGPPARIDPSGEIAGRGLRFADFETAACASPTSRGIPDLRIRLPARRRCRGPDCPGRASPEPRCWVTLIFTMPSGTVNEV